MTDCGDAVAPEAHARGGAAVDVSESDVASESECASLPRHGGDRAGARLSAPMTRHKPSSGPSGSMPLGVLPASISRPIRKVTGRTYSRQ